MNLHRFLRSSILCRISTVGGIGPELNAAFGPVAVSGLRTSTRSWPLCEWRGAFTFSRGALVGKAFRILTRPLCISERHLVLRAGWRGGLGLPVFGGIAKTAIRLPGGGPRVRRIFPSRSSQFPRSRVVGWRSMYGFTMRFWRLRNSGSYTIDFPWQTNGSRWKTFDVLDLIEFEFLKVGNP